MGTRYAEIADLKSMGISPRAISDMPPAQLNTGLDSASAVADGYLADKFTLPLLTWGLDLKMAVVKIAAWELMSDRGFNPEQDPRDNPVLIRYKQAIDWLEGVSEGRIQPSGVSDSTPSSAQDEEVVAVSASQRGWSDRGHPYGRRGPFVSN